VTLTAAVAGLNILLGLVYTQYGTMTIIDMKRSWRTLGFSHFGAAWIAMAFTCGPHHFVHGLHMALGNRTAGPLDLVAVLIGLPAGVAWFLLRVEAFAGGRGDRLIGGTPHWIIALPTLAGVYVAGLAAAMVTGKGLIGHFEWAIVPNMLLVAIYMMIGYYLLRTQLQNHNELKGWSVSGLSLAIIFPTCALMHAVYSFYAFSGSYQFDVHGFTIDSLGVPAGLYFLWVVQGLYRMRLEDWNRSPLGEEQRTAMAT
jgi:hypothetical protein